jgi:hypothetical protein
MFYSGLATQLPMMPPEREALLNSGHKPKGIHPVYVVSITRRILTPLVAITALFALGAGSAHASLLVASGEGCSDYTSSPVFLPFADVASYTMAPGGNFENAASSWNLSNAAPVAGDNEPFDIGSSADSNSLAIGSGGVATSPAMCVGLGQPDLRFFYKRTSGSVLSSLTVDVLFVDGLGNTQSLTIGKLGGVTGAWKLSPQLAIVANLLPLLDDGTPVAFRFSASGGSYQVDDVYVDPWNRP